MAKIFYSVSGEGRGHANRASAIVDSLQHRHEITFFASGNAYDWLAPKYADRESNVRVYPLSGMLLHYRQGRFGLTKSIAKGIRFWSRVTKAVDQTSQLILRNKPDLVITDFEPILPRAAERMGVPYLSIDHQHMLSACDLSELPLNLRIWAALMQLAVGTHYQKQRKTIVTAFTKIPIKAGVENAVSLGPIVRPEVASLRTAPQGGLLSYFRQPPTDAVLFALEQCGLEVKVYGLGRHADRGKVRFLSHDDCDFTEDLARCQAFIGEASNEALGEAVYLRKPVLALLNEKQPEQRINAFYLTRFGLGQASSQRKFSVKTLQNFLDSLGGFEQTLASTDRSGLTATLDAIECQLGGNWYAWQRQVA